MRRLILGLLLVCFVPSVNAQEESGKFDFILVLSQQDEGCDWWKCVPLGMEAKLSDISAVSKGEYFKIIPVFQNYAISSKGISNITYEVKIYRPDGTIYDQETLIGCQGKMPEVALFKAVQVMVICAEPEDPFGEYTVKVIATDNVTGSKVEKSKKMEVKKFVWPSITDAEYSKLFIDYPVHPQPARALAGFLGPTRNYITEDGFDWLALSFIKHVCEDNKFLLPHTVKFFKGKATLLQKKNIILLFHLLNKVEELSVTDKNLNQYIAQLGSMKLPDPYIKISKSDQIHILWGEFFATSRIKPVRHIITAFNLRKYEDMMAKIKAGEVKAAPNKVQQIAEMEAVYVTARRSVMSLCMQSPLLVKYLVGIYGTGKLNEQESMHVRVILQKATEDLKKLEND